MKTYQSHDETSPGMSDSQSKFNALGLPADLAGKHALDLGCNEGFFCNALRKLGAERVVGLDYHEPNIRFAKEKYGKDRGIEFLNKSWHELPEGPFDVVLWTSAMHYEPNPKAVIDKVYQQLAPDGLFVFEGGVLDVPGLGYRLRSRLADTCYYPTADYLVDVLMENFSVRRVAGPYTVAGDSTQRSVYHAWKMERTVVFVNGYSGHRKSTFTRQLFGKTAVNIVSLDEVIVSMMASNYRHSNIAKAVHAFGTTNGMAKLYNEIASSTVLCTEFAEVIARHIPLSDRSVVVEGFMPPAMVSAIKKAIGNAIFWECSRK